MSAVAGPLAAAGSMLWSGLGAVGGLVGMTAGQTALLGASLIGTGISTGVSVEQGKTQQKIAERQSDIAEQEAQFQQGQANVRAEQEKVALGEKRVAVARQAAEERGVLQASGLPVQSIRALVRNVEASRGRGDVAIQTNLEFASQRQAAQKRASELSLAGTQLTIAGQNVSNTQIALGAAGTAVGGLGDAGQLYSGFSSPSGGGSSTAGSRLSKTASSLDTGHTGVVASF